MSCRIHHELIQPRGPAWRDEQIKPWSHYREPIARDHGELHGASRRWGDASAEVQSRVIDELMRTSWRDRLDHRETAHVLAIARIESGFNPDAAAGSTSAAGLGQFIDATGSAYGLHKGNRFQLVPQCNALVRHFIDNRALARRRGQPEAYIYKYHHDGPVRDYGGLEIAQLEVLPYVDRYTRFVERMLLQAIVDTPLPEGGHA